MLAATVFAAAVLIGLTFSPWRQGFVGVERPGDTDTSLYHAEIRRMRHGEGYYQAASAELSQRGYPTRSVFNWRTPLPMQLIAGFPSDATAKYILGGLAAVLVLLSMVVLAEEQSVASAYVCGILMSGAVMFCWLGDSYVMPIIWAEILIGLSLCLYARNRPLFGVLTGLAAIFCRDLAGPYCALCTILAVKNRAWKEVVLWLAGLGAYALYFLWHARQVGLHLSADASSHHETWIQFGGLPFLISLAQVNGYIINLPQWTAACFLLLALLGFASWNSAAGKRIAATAAVYLTLFSVVGHDFNQYWGALLSPLLCFGAARAPIALHDLWNAAFPGRQPQREGASRELSLSA